MAQNDTIKIDTSKLDEIWKTQLDNKLLSESDRTILNRGYHIESEIPKGGVLFLGMNPSYPKKINKIDKDYTFIDIEIEDYEYIKKNIDNIRYCGKTYDLQGIKNICIDKIPDENNTKKYWGPIVEAAVRITCENRDRGINYLENKESEEVSNIKKELQFCHHDLFFVRHTKQEDVIKLYNRYKDFFDEQLKLTKELVIKAEPKIIIVINSGARKIIFDKNKNLWGFIPIVCWDEELGVDIININGKKVPIIFTGMLSSTGRLNKGSENSLFWNIRHICRKMKEKYGTSII